MFGITRIRLAWWRVRFEFWLWWRDLNSTKREWHAYWKDRL